MYALLLVAAVIAALNLLARLVPEGDWSGAAQVVVLFVIAVVDWGDR